MGMIYSSITKVHVRYVYLKNTILKYDSKNNYSTRNL